MRRFSKLSRASSAARLFYTLSHPVYLWRCLMPMPWLVAAALEAPTVKGPSKRQVLLRAERRKWRR